MRRVLFYVWCVHVPSPHLCVSRLTRFASPRRRHTCPRPAAPQNLDHFYAKAPGNFTIGPIINGEPGPILATVEDTSAPSLTYYSTELTVPSMARPGLYVLQVKYNTNNPQAPPTFYQCADVEVAAA